MHEGAHAFKFPAEWAETGPGASPLLGATFFGITGLHMFHVLTGCIYLLVVRRARKKLKHEDVEISGLTGTSSTWCGCVLPADFTYSIYPK